MSLLLWAAHGLSCRSIKRGCNRCATPGSALDRRLPGWLHRRVDDAGAELAVRAEGVRKTFGSVIALDGLSVAVRPGTIYGLLGPNGPGKTTPISALDRKSVVKGQSVGHGGSRIIYTNTK